MTDYNKDLEQYETVRQIAKNTKISIKLEGWPAATAISAVSLSLASVAITALLLKK